MTQSSIRLLEATAASVRAALDKDHRTFASLIGARIPTSFPPDLLDDDALRWTISTIEAPGYNPRYGMFWIIGDVDETPTLVGVAGAKGKPTDGRVEIGYGVVAEYQRRGYATRATRSLVDRAFLDPAVTTLVAETLPDHAASIGVLEKCGFELVGAGSEPGVIQYALRRDS